MIMSTQVRKYPCIFIRCKLTRITSNLASVASSEVFGHPAPKERVVCGGQLSQYTFIFFLVGTQRCRKSACMQNGEDCVTKYIHQRTTRSSKQNQRN